MAKHEAIPDGSFSWASGPGWGRCKTCGKIIVWSAGNDSWLHDTGDQSQRAIDEMKFVGGHLYR